MDKEAKQERFKVWLGQAQYDLDAARLSLEHHFHEWATYQAVQGVEKALKAVLVHAGWTPPRIHKLQVLIGMANNANNEFRMTKFDFRHLESFTFISRYPFLLPGFNQSPHQQISYEDANKAFGQAEDLVNKIFVILKHPAQEPKAAEKEDISFSEAEVGKRIEQIKQVLVREFTPEKIILFGSFARGEKAQQISTLDVMVIAESDLPFIERIVKARTATKGALPVIEPLVYTPKEFRIMEEGGESFLESALKEGKVIYDKHQQV